MSSSTIRSFESLYRAYARDVHGYCLRRTSSEEAKDATSEVFVVAWRRIDDMPAGDEALPWLYGVARNILANRARSSRRHSRLAVKLANQRDEVISSPETQVVQSEVHRDLYRALSKLSEDDREVLRLVEWEGLTRDQVASMFFVSRSAIDKRITRAYKKLARTMGVSTPQVLTTPVTVDEGGEV